MMFAAYDSTLYRLLLLGHIVSFLVAFAPAVVNPIMAAQAKRDGSEALTRLSGYQALNGRRIHFPALIAVGAFGLAMVLTSDDVWAFDQTWVSLAFLVWFGLCGVVSGLILPAERKLAAGDESAEPKVAVGGQIATVLVLVMLYLMIWKPGI
jgi:uncharacterized membrane protein